jgi:hypothetical protein
MAHTKNNVSPEVAQKLAKVAREMRQDIYGEQAFPEWGTRFTDIEQQGMDIGLELARIFMEQSVQEQAVQDIPPEALDCDGETARCGEQQDPAILETPAGELEWQQPKTRLSKARRDFFPSGQSPGD